MHLVFTPLGLGALAELAPLVLGRVASSSEGDESVSVSESVVSESESSSESDDEDEVAALSESELEESSESDVELVGGLAALGSRDAATRDEYERLGLGSAETGGAVFSSVDSYFRFFREESSMSFVRTQYLARIVHRITCIHGLTFHDVGSNRCRPILQPAAVEYTKRTESVRRTEVSLRP